MKNKIIIDKDGNEVWYYNNKKHRTDGPAVIWVCGGTEWWVNGRLHRRDGPAVIYASNEKEWWVNGKRHRIDGPAICDGKCKVWFINNEYIGNDDEGFWNLWSRLNDKQRSNLDLLMHLPKI